MRKRLKQRKGFTLAELLIVVAIISILVAISIPIFTAQLEKAREAVDMANIRSAYAELMADVLTDNTESKISESVVLTQKQDGWQSDYVNIAEGYSGTSVDITGDGSAPSANGVCIIRYYAPSSDDDTATVEFTYGAGGGSSDDSGSDSGVTPSGGMVSGGAAVNP